MTAYRPVLDGMLMRAATVVQVLQDLFYVYCMFYITCDRSLTQYLDSFLLSLARATYVSVMVVLLLLLLLLTDVHRPEHLLHLLYLEVVSQSSDARWR